MVKTIHVFASLGKRNKLAAGGGQTSARRIIKILKDLGYEVFEVNRHVPAYTSDSFSAKLYKIYGYVIDPFIWFFHLLFSSRKNAVTLIIGYSGYLFPFYFLFVRTAKLLRYKTIIYIKGGFTEKKYESFPNWLKYIYKKGLSYSDLSLYEGEVGTRISTKISPKTKALWFPNYIENDFAPQTFPTKNNDRINLIYFGRIHPSKNILLVIDIYDQLCQVFHEAFLTIVGSGNKNYEQLIENRIHHSPNNCNILRIPRMGREELKKIISTQHFFIFPSIEKQEGHSNSLNEAMCCGLVPVVSNNNFLPNIVGVDRLVAHNMTVEAYTNIILGIIESGDYEKLSYQMFERVKKLFCQSVVENKLKEMINSI